MTRPFFNSRQPISLEESHSREAWGPVNGLDNSSGDYLLKGEGKMSNKFGMTDEELTQLVEREKARKEKNLRGRIYQKIIKQKIKAAGITVSDAEIDAELAKQG